MAKRTQKEKQDLLVKFTQQLGLGYNKEEAEENLGLMPGDYESLLSRFYEQAEAGFKSKNNLRIFIDYCTRQSQLVRDLERLKQALEQRNWKNGQAYVGAVKAQSEILDKLISTGQELGLIQKIAEKFIMVGGMDVRDMDMSQLMTSLEQEINDAEKLKKQRKRGKSKVIAFDSRRMVDNEKTSG
jgi:hypothetical protein